MSYVSAGAMINGDYRYSLTRSWYLPLSERLAPVGPGVLWVMLNPSTADAEVDDPTIRRCVSFTRRLDRRRILVVNLFALRATSPADLLAHPDPVGPVNDEVLLSALRQRDTYDLAIVAWGSHRRARPRAEALRRMARQVSRRLWCLGTTRDGSPRHPLYLPAGTPLERWGT